MSTQQAHLSAQLTHRVGSLILDVDFELRAPWTILFGASGSGKSTILRAIAGFIAPQAGRIVLRNRLLFDSQRRVNVPPHLRGLRSAAQAARLFPHKTVLENVAWGVSEPPRAKPLHQHMEEVLGLFDIAYLADTFPFALSGGERQRVAVARAVAAAVHMPADLPSGLLLLDEPFTGLDFALRDRLAVQLREWLRTRGVPVLSVTHDVAEAFLLDADVLRLENGRIEDQGPATRVLAGERERLLRQLQRP